MEKSFVGSSPATRAKILIGEEDIVAIDSYEQNMLAAEDKILPLLTDDFLKTLTEVAKTCGWNVDHTETIGFVNWCHDIVEKPRPDVTAYPYN